MMNMNCQLFEVVIDDLARDRCPDERTRTRALEHAEQCPSCARRLAELRRLASALDELASATVEKEPSREVEDLLVMRFRQWQGAARRPAWPARFGWPAWLGALGRPAWLWSAAAAAIAALVLGAGMLLAPVWRRSRSPQKPFGGSARASVQAPGRGPSAVSTPLGSESVTAGWPEDFLPLPYGDDTGPIVAAQVVTVKLSAEDLQDIGLPDVDLNHRQYVTAEIVIGEDGIARGIRFVQ